MQQPGVREVLASLEGRIDDAAMRRLNLAVDRDHRSPHEVAQAFLLEHGLSR